MVDTSGNAGTIQPGTTVGDAKRGFFDEDDDQEETSWDSTENY